MYIQPNSDIKILKNIPFDNSYKDTIYFTSNIEQYNYFNSFTKYTLTSQYYARVNDGILKVEEPIQNLQDCNYLMFRNVSFGNKWFYAFITSVEYVNNLTTRITFELDLMQTYFFDVALKQCYVEREHSATDEIGDNIQDEKFSLDDYVYQNFDSITWHDLDDLIIIVAYARNYTVGERIREYSIIDNTIQCVDLFAYELTQTGALHLGEAIDKVVSRNKIDEIVDIYSVPRFALPEGVSFNAVDFENQASAIPSRSVGKHITASVVKPTAGATWSDVKASDSGTWVPKNNKLYTYPYWCLELSTPMGQKVQYAFEDFGGDNATFEILSTLTNPVQLSIYPRYFKRLGGSESLPLNSETGLTIANFPKSAFSSDAYKAWLAQNSVPMLVDTIMATAGGAIAGAMFGGAFGAGAGAGAGALAGTGAIDTALVGGLVAGGSKTVDNAMKAYSASRTSDATRGSINNGNALHSQGIYVFNKATKHIPNQVAHVIDDYFTLYGYATHRVKYPNRAVREKFTYTKTVGCNMRGSCPADDIKKINAIYDNGIRFWMPSATVGDYSGTNYPIGE